MNKENKLIEKQVDIILADESYPFNGATFWMNEINCPIIISSGLEEDEFKSTLVHELIHILDAYFPYTVYDFVNLVMSKLYNDDTKKFRDEFYNDIWDNAHGTHDLTFLRREFNAYLLQNMFTIQELIRWLYEHYHISLDLHYIENPMNIDEFCDVLDKLGFEYEWEEVDNECIVCYLDYETFDDDDVFYLIWSNGFIIDFNEDSVGILEYKCFLEDFDD